MVLVRTMQAVMSAPVAAVVPVGRVFDHREPVAGRIRCEGVA